MSIRIDYAPMNNMPTTAESAIARMSEYIVNFLSNEINDLVIHERIIRCRDCKHFEYCQFHRHSENKPNGFCAWGETKERIEQ